MFLYNIFKSSVLVLVGGLAGSIVYLLLPYVWITAGIIIIGRKVAGNLASVFESVVSFSLKRLQSCQSEGKSEKSEPVET